MSSSLGRNWLRPADDVAGMPGPSDPQTGRLIFPLAEDAAASPGRQDLVLYRDGTRVTVTMGLRLGQAPGSTEGIVWGVESGNWEQAVRVDGQMLLVPAGQVSAAGFPGPGPGGEARVEQAIRELEQQFTGMRNKPAWPGIADWFPPDHEFWRASAAEAGQAAREA